MTIVIPAYKPDEKLLALIRSLKEKTKASLLVVNDGSGADFEPIFEAVEALNCTLLVHPQNKGKGAALKTAFAYLKEHGAPDEILCTADADGQHLPEDILRCMKEAEEHPEALVLGSRGFDGSVPLRSRFGNSASRITFHLLMGKKVQDTQTGLRAFSAKFLDEMLAVPGDRYEYEMQMLCRFAKKKLPIREVIIQTVYIEENKSSHFNPVRDALRVYGILFRAALGSFFQIVTFLISSLLAVVIDLVGFYLLFNLFLRPVMTNDYLAFGIALVLARIISSIANYLINRGVVFENLENPTKTLLLYFLLVVFIFFGNYFLGIFFFSLGINELISEMAAQVLCFPISFLVQKFWIFPKKKGDV